jgi:hypothetical protein
MKGSRIGLRWIALRLSEQPREAAERRKKRTACRKQQQVQHDTLSSSRLGSAGDHLTGRAME